MLDLLKGIYSKVPSWVSTGTITSAEAAVLSSMVQRLRPRVLVEVGTASGVSTAVLAAAADAADQQWELHTFDIMEVCYFDETKIVGQAALDILGERPNVHFHRSSTALDIKATLGDRQVDFVFIDASHSSPWAAIDLLSILPNLREGAVIALHDVLLPFHEGYSHQNAARDIFRVWRGQKWTEASAPNLGILRFTDLKQTLTDIATLLQADWDIARNAEVIDDFVSLLSPFAEIDYPGEAQCRMFFAKCVPEVINGNQHTKPAPFPFACGSQVHPNHTGDALRVIWKGLPTSSGTHLLFSAYASNGAADNPGAVVSVRDLNRKPDEIHSISVEPRTRTFIDFETGNCDYLDLEIAVTPTPGLHAYYAGIELSPFTVKGAGSSRKIDVALSQFLYDE
ncbi:hypothetical protein MPC4_170051 [Methylocella tundrae]|uniref:Methyltransferase domain-containing protein n=2 Tax=Methylocella tundrae TaxID=227605 RepID=A0A8B6M5A9_METTU|nr:hypothetical protein MPC1_20009 [Methylocella tundrae]VTZ49520.1 hypothetical protein MPC4_170051 [Methylocella tundrae]